MRRSGDTPGDALADALADARSRRAPGRLRQLVATLSEEGARSAWLKSLQELGVYRRLVLTEIGIAPTPPRPTAASVETHELGLRREDLEAYARLRPDTPPDSVTGRLAAGDVCFAAWLDGRLASAVWASRTRASVEYLECEIELRAGDVYIYDSFTLPELRGKDLASWRMEALKDHFRRTGVERALAAHVPENRNQVRRAERRAHLGLAMIGWCGIGRWRRLFVRPLAGTGASRESLPELRWPDPERLSSSRRDQPRGRQSQ